MQHVRSFMMAVGLLLVGLSAGVRGQEQASSLPQVDDAAILEMFKPSLPAELPPRLFTPAVVQALRERKPTLVGQVGGKDGRVGVRMATALSDEQWRALIPAYSGFTMRTERNLQLQNSGRCPFCGKLYQGLDYPLDRLLDQPFQAPTKCCGAMVYEHEADMPADYPAKPNVTVSIADMNGTPRDYRFYAPPGTEAAGPEISLKRKDWFCSQAEVWWARAYYFQNEEHHGPTLLPNLTGAAFNGNDQAARTLAVIYDRLAEVWPGYLLVDNGKLANGIARGAAGKTFLTGAEYKATPIPARWRHPAWLRTDVYYNLMPLNHCSSWQDGVLANCAEHLQRLDYLSDHPAVLVYSRERYGDEQAWNRHVRKGFIDEIAFLAKCCKPSPGGNVMGVWIGAAIRLGIALQDRYFIETAIECIDPVIDNHYLADGMSVEAAYNYAGMMRPIIAMADKLERELGLDFTTRHPLLPLIRQTSDRPIMTLLGNESMHNDQHTNFFRSGITYYYPPWTPDYGKYERAQSYSIYGLTALRGGAPGMRMETIMDYHQSKNHTGLGRLRLQTFYEGVTLMPNIGYACGAADISQAPWPSLQYPFAKLDKPQDTDFWGAWYFYYGGTVPMQLMGLVDGEVGPAVHRGPVTFRRYLGGAAYDSPAYNAQLIDVGAEGLFVHKPEPVDVFQRQTVMVTLADGRPLTLDFHRMRGGKRHDLCWHAPATAPDEQVQTSLTTAPTPLPGSMLDLYNQVAPQRAHVTRKGWGEDWISSLQQWSMPQQAWNITYHIRPELFAPVSAEGAAAAAKWTAALKPADLRLWSGAVAGAAEPTVTEQSIITGRAPWPSKMLEKVNGQFVGPNLISLKDAFHTLMVSRSSAELGLSSTFATVIEPYQPEQKSFLGKVEVLKPDHLAAVAPDAMGAGLRLTTDAGSELWAATTRDGGSFASGALKLHGRLGVAEPSAQRLTLYDGTRFAVGEMAVELQPSWNLPLLGVIGDLTGHPGEMALLVETDRPLPTDQTLVGRTLTVAHQISSKHTTGYEIARVTSSGAQRYRIDLAGVGTFIDHRVQVVTVLPNNPRVYEVNYSLLKGNNHKGLYDGKRLRLLQQRFETSMVMPQHVGTAWHRAFVELTAAPPQPVEVGDPLIIFTIQPGDRVIIPSHFASQGVTTDAGPALQIVATGAATMRVPGYQPITLTAADLPDGKATVTLKP